MSTEPTTTTTSTVTAPTPPDFLHRAETAVSDVAHAVEHGAASVVTGAISAAHAVESSQLFAAIQPDLRDAYAKLLPPLLKEGEAAIASLFTAEHWKVIAMAGPFAEQLFADLVARIALPAVAAAATAV